MALSMDEQRILDEMERKLADEDPRLASRLASFSSPGLSGALRSPRARLIAMVATLAAVAVVALTVYSMMSFRAVAGRPGTGQHRTPTPDLTRPLRAGPGGGMAGLAGRKR